jgi:hypothetical protein
MDVKLDINDPPREFEVGFGEIIRLKDCAHIALEPDEQVTFLTESGAEYDVARKSWGFYATPSLNGRLERFNLRGVMVKNRKLQYFIMLVERGKESLFQRYLVVEQLTIVCWLDSSQALQRLEQAIRST